MENSKIDDIKRELDSLIMEMNDDRNDGWVKEHFRKSLIEIRKYIDKALDK